MSELARMLAWVHQLPDQLRDAADLDGLDALAPLPAKPAQALLCGMGGSAIAGDLLPLHWPGPPQPWWVHRDAGLPPWAGPDTLVIASSHSGDTAETLAAAAEARRRGCPLVALTGGGRLAKMAAPTVVLPRTGPPRTALGTSFAALVHVLHRLGLAEDPTPALTAAAAEVQASPPGPDPAAVAAGLAGRFVMVYTSGQEAFAAGRRLRAQLNENAKTPSAVSDFPELTHNEIVGWRLSAERREGFALVVLRGADEDDVTRRRREIALELLGREFAVVHEVAAAGGTPLGRTLGLVHWADLLSVEVARRLGVDPVAITRIVELKNRMSEEI